MRQRGRWLSSAIGILVVVTACAGPSSAPSAGPSDRVAPAQSSGPKRVTAVIRGAPFALAAAVNEIGAGSVPGVDQVEQLLNAGLSGEDLEGRIQPRLAEQVPSVENGLWKVLPDGRMETTWHLRPNLSWHDGAPFTSDDLVFAMQVAQEPRAGFAIGQAYELIEKVEAPDARTFTLTWSKPFIRASALFGTAPTSNLRLMPLPRHLLERPFLEDPTSFTQLSYWTRDFVGLGPFKLVDYLEGSHMEGRANETYALGRPKIDEITVRFMADPATIAANLLAGAVELTLNSRLSVDWGVQVRDQWRDGRLEPTQGTNLVALFPQLLTPTPPLVGQLTFREGLTRAIDRQELSDVIQAGLAPIAHSLIPPHIPEFAAADPLVPKFDYDPRRAVQTFESMGLTRGPDGAFRDQSGQRISMELRTRQGDDLQEKMLASVSDYWQRVGIATEHNVFGAQRANDREFRSTYPAFEVVRQPGGPEAIIRYSGAEVPTAENAYRGNNRPRYRHPELDALIDRYSVTIPEGERNQIVAQAAGHMSRNIVIIGLNFSVDATMVANRIQGVSGKNSAWNAHEWDVK
jgi:peptide/nickel transport system substrate-binding protein